MTNENFKAVRVYETPEGKFHRSIETRKIEDLPKGDVLIRVKFAALNYKDALSCIGNKGVTKSYPHTPGVDASGVVEESSDDRFNPGDEVIATSYDLGMNTDGAFAEFIRVPGDWVIPKPANLSLAESMIVGTAGVTAGIGLLKLERMGQHPAMGPIVVTGASGGVGSIAVALYAHAGYEVIAATGKTEAHSLLKTLGASEIVSRDQVDDDSGKPLMRTRWAGGFDNVGGNTLATLLKCCKNGGSIATCGLVASPALTTTVFPFILNGVNLLGVDSATFPIDERKNLWAKLATDWRIDQLDRLSTFISLNDLDGYIDKILNGKTLGRVVVAL